MSRTVTLLIACLAWTLAGPVSADEKTWSIGVDKDGVKVKELEKEQPTAGQQAPTSDSPGIMGGGQQRPLEEDLRWHKARPFDTAIDVDTAYALIKQEFDFATAEERLAQTPGVMGNLEMLKRSSGFEYVATPGAHYKMRDKTPRTDRVVEVEISKIGNNSRIEFGFVNIGLRNVRAYEQQLKTRIRSALR